MYAVESNSAFGNCTLICMYDEVTDKDMMQVGEDDDELEYDSDADEDDEEDDSEDDDEEDDDEEDDEDEDDEDDDFDMSADEVKLGMFYLFFSLVVSFCTI